ncbi:ABC1 kinase family protein [Paractinoplanes ovalisporus]|uniref:ABC1 kinase family protein n=1 Tax=Paractinoplanes ovalisporus TaxID=2810368 RepID=UPI001F268012|nr:AarF/UbiB family protein [Actinoplanes ovalisporus]
MRDSLVVAGALAFAVLVMAIVIAASRLLGLRIGVIRTLLAGGVAVLTTTLVSRAMEPASGTVALMPVAAGITLLVSMLFLLVANALVPPSRNPVSVLRAVRGSISRTRRYLQILVILVRHGLAPYLRRRPLEAASAGRARLARQLRSALEEAGVTFIKVGQALSARRDLLPPEFITELSRLQQNVAPAKWDEIRVVLEEELGTSPELFFAEFDPEPVAAASVSQVHTAQLRSGRQVVVKVQRPNIRSLVGRDLDIVIRLARTLERRTGWGRSLGILDLAHGFAAALTEELDFRVEAANVAAVRDAAIARLGPELPIVIPPICDELTSARVLVIERVDGISPSSTEQFVRSEEDRSALATKLLVFMLEQIIVDGVFHCDPHPGNILILRDGGAAMLDFGVVGRLDRLTQQALEELLLAIEIRDRAALCDALLEVIGRPADLELDRLERALGQFMASYLGPGSPPTAEMFLQLFRMLSVHGLRVPPEVAAVFRALSTLQSTLWLISPGYDVIAEARSFGSKRVAEQLRPTEFVGTMFDDVIRTFPMLRRLPRRLDRIAQSLEQGRFTVQVRLFADERERTFLNELFRKLVLAFLAATTGLMAVLFLSADGSPRVAGNVTLYEIIGYNLLVVSAALILRGIAESLRRDP